MTKDEALNLALEAMKVSNSAWKSLADSGDAGFWKAEKQGYYQLNEQAIKAVEAALEAKDEPLMWNEGVPAMLPKQKEGETFIVSYEPQQEAKDEPWEKFCDSHCVWTDHHPDCKLAQQEAKDKPMHPDIKKLYEDYFDKCFRESSPLQRTWVGLTDEEIHQIFIANSVVVDNGNAYMVAGLRTVNIARAIEAAHGIKGEA